MFPEKTLTTRHPSLLDARRSTLAVVDLQEGFARAIPDFNAVVARATLLVRVAARLGVPTLVSEQYPKGLGPTVSPLAGALPPQTPIHEKLCFSASDLPAWTNTLKTLRATRRNPGDQVILCGVEAHVCVLQTALDLAAADVSVYVVEDAVSSRRATDARAALRRLASYGVQIVTSEMVIFEWLRQAGTEEFKDVREWVKERDKAPIE